MKVDNADIPTVSLEYLYSYISKNYTVTGDELLFLATVPILDANGDVIDSEDKPFIYGGNLGGTTTAEDKSIGKAITLRDAIENHTSSKDFNLENIYLESIYENNSELAWNNWSIAFGTEKVEINLSLLFANDNILEPVTLVILREYVDEEGNNQEEYLPLEEITPTEKQFWYDLGPYDRYYAVYENEDDDEPTYKSPYEYSIIFEEGREPANDYYFTKRYQAGDSILLGVVFSPKEVD